MPALAADIAAATAPGGRVLVEAANAGLKATTPNARDGASEAAEGWFDQQADAQVIINERFSLLGVPRRRLLVRVDGLRFDLLPTTVVPTVHFRDAEQAADGNFLISRVQIDLAANQTTLELFG